MQKKRVTYRCDRCGHAESVLFYVEGYGLDAAAFERERLDEINRARHERAIASTCGQCGATGFHRDEEAE